MRAMLFYIQNKKPIILSKKGRIFLTFKKIIVFIKIGTMLESTNAFSFYTEY